MRRRYGSEIETQVRVYREQISDLAGRSYIGVPVAATWRDYDADTNALTVSSGAVAYTFDVPAAKARELFLVKEQLKTEPQYSFSEAGRAPMVRSVTLVGPLGDKYQKTTSPPDMLTPKVTGSAGGLSVAAIAMQRFQNNQFPEFESLAAEALSAGASLTFTLQHHHDWGQVHPVTITINRTSIRFEAGGLSEIPYQNNNAIHIGIVKDRNGNPDAPPSSCEVSSLSGDIQRIVSTEVSTNKNSEIFLNMKIREPHGQSIRNLNFADQFAAKEQWVKKAGMGVGVTKRTVRSRPEAMAALSAVQRAIQRAHSLSEGWAITDKKPAARTPITEPPPGNSFLNREVTKERSARALLGLVQDAMGGRERLAAIRDWQRKAKVTWAPQKGTTELMTIFVAPSSLKEESRGGNKTTEYSNGQAGWTWSSSKGITRELPSPTAAGMVLRTLNTLVLSDGNPSRAVNLLALDTVEVHDEFNNTAALTVDMKSHLPAKLSWRNLDGAMLEETYFDWREINGTMWWFRMTRARDGQTFLEERVRDYRINTGLTEPDLSVRP